MAALGEISDVIESRTELRRAERAFLRRCALEAAASAAVHRTAPATGGLCLALEGLLAVAADVIGRPLRSASALQSLLQREGNRHLARRVEALARGRLVEAHPDASWSRMCKHF